MTPATGHRVTRALGRALVALALVLSTGCTSSPGLGSPGDLSRAEEWFAAYHDALRQGAFNTGPFYAKDAHLDLTTLEGAEVTGRESVLQAIGGAFVPFRDRTPEPGGLYLSRMGAVEAAPIKGPAEDPNRLLAIDTFGAQGMTSQVFALSVLAWRERLQGDPRMLAVQTVAQDWATAWSSTSGTALADLYAPSATLTDDLMGVRTQSRDEITALTALPAQSGGLDQVAIDKLSDVSGPAVFVVTPPGLHHSDPMRSMAMLVTTQGDQCPGHLAVVLKLDEQGRITHEQRYHRVDTLTRCVGQGPGAAEAGPRWWDAVTIPPAVAKIQTGSLSLDGRDVAMFNSTPGLDGLIPWAADRFTAAGLTPPTVTEVSFYGEHLDVCKDIHGLAAGTTLSLCFVEKTACTDLATCTQWTAQAKATALHELGHLWIWAGLDTRTIDADTTRRFIEQAGLPTWADTDHEWKDRGMELAAVTISWALTDDPFVHPLFADRCNELGSLFTTLTGEAAPATAQCAIPAKGRMTVPARWARSSKPRDAHRKPRRPKRHMARALPRPPPRTRTRPAGACVFRLPAPHMKARHCAACWASSGGQYRAQ